MPFFCLHAMYSVNGENGIRQLDKKFMNLYSFLERCLAPTWTYWLFLEHLPTRRVFLVHPHWLLAYEAQITPSDPGSEYSEIADNKQYNENIKLEVFTKHIIRTTTHTDGELAGFQDFINTALARKVDASSPFPVEAMFD